MSTGAVRAVGFSERCPLTLTTDVTADAQSTEVRLRASLLLFDLRAAKVPSRVLERRVAVGRSVGPSDGRTARRQRRDTAQAYA